jgi:hypothetical protein
MKTLTVRKPAQRPAKTNWMKLGMILCLGMAVVTVIATKRGQYNDSKA